MVNILYLGDSESDKAQIEAILKQDELSFEIVHVRDKKEFTEALQYYQIDVIYADYTLSSMSANESLSIAQEHAMQLPYIIISNTNDADNAINLMREGATDYFIRDNLEKLVLITKRVIRNSNEAQRRDLIEKEIRDAKDRYENLIKNIPDIVYSFVTENIIKTTFMSDTVSLWTGYHARYFYDFSNAWLDVIHEDDKAEAFETYKYATRSAKEFEHEYRIVHKDTGQIRYVREHGLPYFDEAQQKVRYDGIITDVTSMKEAERNLLKLARFDPMTELPNRISFHDELNKSLLRAKRSESIVGILFVHINAIKNMAELKGFKLGDKLLSMVAKKVEKQLPKQALLCRLANDELGIVVENLSSVQEMGVIADDIIKVMNTTVILNDEEVNTSVNIGMSAYPGTGRNLEELILQGKQALHNAKLLSPNTYQFFTKSLNKEIKRYVDIERMLRPAIENNEFYLMYQPQYNLNTGKICYIEVLLRWNNPFYHDISPSEFIPIAEDAGLIGMLGKWVIKNALMAFASWRNTDPAKKDIKIGIKLSLSEIQSHNFSSWLLSKITQYNLKPQDVTLEVVELFFTEHAKESAAMLTQAYNAGVQIAITDFGVGFSSLKNLRDLPVNTIKVDKTFIKKITESTQDLAIVKSIKILGKSLNLAVVAEGVETKEQLQLLQKLGYGYAQGFYFSKPTTLNSIDEMIDSKGQSHDSVA